ncbi:hypothetical protein Q082_01196 [Pseudomonas aeruginosa M8A.3]|nr:hypothetical protein Q081_03085 [Pseudomonas aeruginosa M8A.2]ERZ48800.1 hypothetical protein Q082_01196 [Pseudomonas aeruginosa M8A.3]
MRAKIFRYGGSSPRMWGTLGIRDYVLQRLRFIPTHVGNTSLVRTPRSIPTVHPHACGEHRVGRRRLHPATGSSPRMWGTRCARQCRGVGERFIPTHVGNTLRCDPRHVRQPVHPHACGEHRSCIKRAKVRNGSSPRMWGTRLPAWCAGAPLAVHPHACGEHDAELVLMPEDAGSSPRMWGTPEALPRQWHCKPVHPHACGEHWSPAWQFFAAGGSSPRMWGTPEAGEKEVLSVRFIPTHVGNTFMRWVIFSNRPVHPHACGEHTYRTALFLKKKKHFEKSTASSSIPWSDPEAGMPPIAARRTTLDVDG